MRFWTFVENLYSIIILYDLFEFTTIQTNQVYDIMPRNRIAHDRNGTSFFVLTWMRIVFSLLFHHYSHEEERKWLLEEMSFKFRVKLRCGMWIEQDWESSQIYWREENERQPDWKRSFGRAFQRTYLHMWKIWKLIWVDKNDSIRGAIKCWIWHAEDCWDRN